MTAIELVVIIAEAEWDGQAYGYRLTCRADDWDRFEWMREHYAATVVREARRHVPRHVRIRTTTRRETREGGTP